MPLYRRLLPAVLIAMFCFEMSTQSACAQFGLGGVGGAGGMGGIGGMGGGGAGSFSPSVTNSLNQGRTGPSSALGLFERSRQENPSARTSKYSDDSFSKPLNNKGIGASDGMTGSARRLLNRRRGEAVSERTGPNGRSDGSPYRIPPGLREVKNSLRIAREKQTPGSIATESRPDAATPSQ